jgi:FixJ family two-component response regulator
MVRKAKFGDPVTAREREVVGFIVEGLRGKEIATRLDVSPRTVEIHRLSAMKKIGARTIADLVRITLTGS